METGFPFASQLECLGERRELPSGVHGRVLGLKMDFSAFQGHRNVSTNRRISQKCLS